MKKCKILLLIIVTLLAIFSISNRIYGAINFETLLKNAEQEIATFTGTTNNHNSTEVAKAIALLKQNPEATQQLLNSIDGREYENLRKWIGIEDDGSAGKYKAAQTVYTLASMLDSNNHFLKNSCEQTDFNTYLKGSFTAQSKTQDDFLLHKIQLNSTSQVGNELDKTTWAHVLSITQDTSAKEELEAYFNNNIVTGSANSLADKTCMDGLEEGEYISFDKEAAGMDINVSTGDNEATEGDSFNEAKDDALEDIIDNSNASNRNENIETNWEQSTGEKIPEWVFEYQYTPPEVNQDPSFTLENLKDRVEDLIKYDKNEQLSGLLNLFTGDGTEKDPGIIGTITSIGTYLMYAAILFFGLRCIWSGVEGKTQFKELLPYLLIGIIFFNSADNLVALAEIVFGNTDYPNYVQDVWSNVLDIVRIIAFAGIIFLGIKFIFAAPSGKADIKSSLIPVLIGCIFVFASSTIVKLVIDISNEAGLEDIQSPSESSKYINILNLDENEETKINDNIYIC